MTVRANRSGVRSGRLAGVGLVAVCGAVIGAAGAAIDGVAAHGGTGAKVAMPAGVAQEMVLSRIGGHPSFAGPVGGGSGEVEQGEPILPDPPLVSGPYVNFESPPVRPLALTSAGDVLLAVNTPNGRLVVLDATGPLPFVLREIPVGIEPVAVAIQPGTGDRLAWVVNMVSDNVSVADIEAGVVVDVVEVGDEPANILFDEAGVTAFVVLQSGRLVAIDTATRQVVGAVDLPCHTPRAAGWHQGRLVVAALHSGNNTTVVGQPILFFFEELEEPILFPLLWVPQFFAATAGIFAHPDLSPWPDPPNVIEDPSPLVMRIVPDAGVSEGPWAEIVDVLSTETGEPDPLMVAAFAQQVFDELNLTITNAFDVIAEVIDDAKDTEDNDLLVVDVSDPSNMQVVEVVSGVGTTLTGLAVNPATQDVFVSNLEALNRVRLEPNLRGHFVDHEMVIVRGLPNPVIEKTDLHAGIPNFNDVSGPNLPAQAGSLANPVDVVFRPDGSRAYVAALGVGRIGVLDGTTGAVLGRADVGRGPRGLALDAVRDRLYVLNRTDMTISVVDVSTDSPVLVGSVPLFTPEPPVVRGGRDFLYSTRFSNNFGSSCALCHVDGRLDHLAWDLGNPDGLREPPPPPFDPATAFNHPVKGPMVTLSLQGLKGHEPFHWRGDRPTFADFNGAFESLLGGRRLSDAEMAAYTAFVESIVYPPNPFRNRDNTFVDPQAGPGMVLYRDNCQACHMTNNDGALALPDIEADGGMDLSGIFAQLQLVTQLRGIHKKFESDRFTGFGLIHDGREEREEDDHPLETFLKTFFPHIGNDPVLSAQLIAFVTAFPTNVAPVVGWQVMPKAPVSPGERAAIQLMISQHLMDPSRCDVIAKGEVNGEMTGLLFVTMDGGEALFISDEQAVFTLDELLAGVEAGDRLVFTAVPPGSGRRSGIDEDTDCLPDGLDPEPQENNFGDSDFDGDLDIVDFATLSGCFTGSGRTYPQGRGCELFDSDCDGDVDILDFATFSARFTGSQ